MRIADLRAMIRRGKHPYAVWAFWCFAVTLNLLPLGLGGDRPLPLGLAQAGLAFSCLFLVLDSRIWREVIFFDRIRLALGLLALVLVWALIQTQPLVPDSWQHPLWQEAASVLKIPLRGAIAVSPEDGLKGLAHIITYLAAGILAYIFALDATRALRLLRLFWCTGLAVCVYGLLVYLTGSATILWFKKWAYLDDVTATFVNHNHFAIYAGMVMITGAALLFRSYQQDVQSQPLMRRRDIVKQWGLKVGLPQGIFLAVVLATLVLSHSRAGLMLSLAGCGAYFFFYQIYMKAWGRAFVILILSILTVICVLWLALHVSDRFAVLFKDYSSLDRWQVDQMGWHILWDNPWLGYGLNGFEPEFRLYQQNMLMEFNHAHNDVLESLIDLGLPLGLLLWGSIGLLISGLCRGLLRRRQNGLFPALALAATCVVLAHACVDFSLQIPGVAMIWASLLGIGLAQSWRQSEK